MPIPIIVSPSYPVHDRVVTWPVPPLVALFPTYDVPVPCSHHTDTNPPIRNDSQNRGLGYTSDAAGGNTHRITPAQGGSVSRLVGRIANDAGGLRAMQWEGLAVGAILDASALAPGVSLASIDRVYRFRLFLQARMPVLTFLSRTLLVPFDQAIASTNRPSNLVGANNRGGFGIAGDGAGQWQYVSYNRTGVNLLYESVPLPVHGFQNVVNCFEWVRINGRPGFETEWVFRWNGEDFLSRNYAGGLLEPLDATLDEWAYCPMVEASGAAAGVMYYNMDCTWGRFLPNGVEIQG